jgi:hypothetical protein
MANPMTLGMIARTSSLGPIRKNHHLSVITVLEFGGEIYPLLRGSINQRIQIFE